MTFGSVDRRSIQLSYGRIYGREAEINAATLLEFASTSLARRVLPLELFYAFNRLSEQSTIEPLTLKMLPD